MLWCASETPSEVLEGEGRKGGDQGIEGCRTGATVVGQGPGQQRCAGLHPGYTRRGSVVCQQYGLLFFSDPLFSTHHENSSPCPALPSRAMLQPDQSLMKEKGKILKRFDVLCIGF